MAATVKPVERVEPGVREQSYLPELVRGLALTNRRFWENFLRRKHQVTYRYPEVKRPYVPRYRGHHRLMKREDGQVRCVACMMCSTACPANCIHIVAGEHPDRSIEKYPVRFDIDMLVCIYCGMCEEACPCDAIRLDSGQHPMPSYSREASRRHKEDLLALGSLSISKQGGKYA